MLPWIIESDGLITMLAGSYKLAEQMERHSYRIMAFQDERLVPCVLGEPQKLFSQLPGCLQVSLGDIEETQPH